MSETQEKDYKQLKRTRWWHGFWTLVNFISISGLIFLYHGTVTVTKTIVTHVETWDASALIADSLRSEFNKYKASTAPLHIVYDKVCLKDTSLNQNEKNVLRADENGNFVTSQ